jgi:chemotaxis protein CheX
MMKTAPLSGRFFSLSDYQEKESNPMQASYINPFLSSSVHVIEQLTQVRASVGQLTLKRMETAQNLIWLRIGIIGQMKGDIIFEFPKHVALKLVSSMMGGYAVTDLDEMSQSAIAELGNMISGNASTLLSNDGILIDITPPNIMESAAMDRVMGQQQLSVPLFLEKIGEFRLSVNLSQKSA